VTVAVVLLSLATAAVLLALPTQSPMWLSVASVLALVCGWAAARIVYTELLQSRQYAAADRAAQAQAYKSMFAERASEHAEFTTAMTDRLAARDREAAELQASVIAAQKRAVDAESRVQREARRANEAERRADEAEAKVAELSDRVQELEIKHAEQADELASWEGFETVVDLMAWEQKISAAVKAAQVAGPEQKQA
jgi:hypothetical protein